MSVYEHFWSNKEGNTSTISLTTMPLIPNLNIRVSGTNYVNPDFESNVLNFVSKNVKDYIRLFVDDVARSNVRLYDGGFLMTRGPITDLAHVDRPNSNAGFFLRAGRPTGPQVCSSTIIESSDFSLVDYYPFVSVNSGVLFLENKQYHRNNVEQSLGDFSFDYQDLQVKDYLRPRLSFSEGVEATYPTKSTILSPWFPGSAYQRRMKLSGFVFSLCFYRPNLNLESLKLGNHFYMTANLGLVRYLNHSMLKNHTREDMVKTIYASGDMTPLIYLKQETSRIEVRDVI